MTVPTNFNVCPEKSPSINGVVVFVFAIINLLVTLLNDALLPASLPIKTLLLPVFALPAL